VNPANCQLAANQNRQRAASCIKQAARTSEL